MTDEAAERRRQVQSYLTSQSAKLSAVEIAGRVDEAGQEFFAALRGVPGEVAGRRPAPEEWSVAEVVDHVTLTMRDALAVMRALASGTPPGAPLEVGIAPVNADRPFAELVERLRRSHDTVALFLATYRHEPHADLRVPHDYFGEQGWKAYALLLRGHYKDHLGQVRRTLAALGHGGAER